jgi:hypothetical protein
VTFLWITFSVLYIILLVSLGLMTLRKGHTVLFVLGFFFPLLWIIGAMLVPTQAAETREARASLQ